MSITILSDIKNNIANQFGLVFTLSEKMRELNKSLGANLLDFNDDDIYTLPIPATYLIGQDKRFSLLILMLIIWNELIYLN
ncbi:hypothetical protein [Gilliamella sp. N-G2]|uniref:hypothetical protein n=1 Tax=unclassified Gilliamella TaxID=2685620 RepID=UPI0035279019